MNPGLKSYILSFMPSDVPIPKALRDKGEEHGQASKNGLIIALQQGGVLLEEVRELLGVPDYVPHHGLLQDWWLPTREITISQLLEEVEKILE